MDGKPPALWDDSTNTPEVRLPNTPPSTLLKNDIKNNENKIEEKADNKTSEVKSKLSADAPEWYPPNYQKNNVNEPQQQPIRSNIQARLKVHKAPINDSTVNSVSNHIDYYQGSDFIDSPDDIRLKHLVRTLIKDPGQFTDLLDIFMETLYPYSQDIIVLSRATHLLVNQAIDNASFRYTAARLCYYIEQQCPAFRAELHLTCTKELERNGNKSGLLLFVAELYSQLDYENLYGSYLIDAYRQLIELGGNDNIKAICQALKLTGHSLELYNKKALDEVMEKLKTLKPTVTGTALNLIDSVINLRGSNWGHTSPVTSNNSNNEQENYCWGEIQNPVFYNSEGMQFSNEESEFLAANMYCSEEYLTDGSDPDDLCDPEPEMDEEIQAAFKDFVKLSKR